MVRPLILVLVVLTSALSPAFGQPTGPGPRRAFEGQLGAGTWVGAFRDHLARDGAYLDTPVLDAAVLLALGHSWGAAFLAGSSSVVHPKSKPIEGTFACQGAGLWASFPALDGTLRLGAAAGFQHATSLLGAYSMGYAEASAGCSWPLEPGLSWGLTLRCRSGIFPAVTIPALYQVSQIDVPVLVSVSAGLLAEF